MPELDPIVRLGVAERGDNERDTVLRGRVEGRIPDAMDELPEAGCAKVEQRARQIDRGMIVEQPPRHQAKQRFCDCQLAGGWRAVEENQFHS